MADNEAALANGNSTELDHTEHPAKNTTSVTDVDELNQRIETLEREKSESEAKIGELETEIESLRREKEASASDLKATESIAKRAFELEGQVVRLEHDLLSALNEGEELNRENHELNSKIAKLEEKARKEKDERENEFSVLKREKKEVEDSLGKLQDLLKESEDKVEHMEKKMEELVKKSEESEKLIGGLMEKVTEREVVVEVDENHNNGGFKGLKTQLPVIGAVSAAVVVTAALAACYIRRN